MVNGNGDEGDVDDTGNDNLDDNDKDQKDYEDESQMMVIMAKRLFVCCKNILPLQLSPAGTKISRAVPKFCHQTIQHFKPAEGHMGPSDDSE